MVLPIEQVAERDLPEIAKDGVLSYAMGSLIWRTDTPLSLCYKGSSTRLETSFAQLCSMPWAWENFGSLATGDDVDVTAHSKAIFEQRFSPILCMPT